LAFFIKTSTKQIFLSPLQHSPHSYSLCSRNLSFLSFPLPKFRFGFRDTCLRFRSNSLYVFRSFLPYVYSAFINYVCSFLSSICLCYFYYLNVFLFSFVIFPSSFLTFLLTCHFRKKIYLSRDFFSFANFWVGFFHSKCDGGCFQTNPHVQIFR